MKNNISIIFLMLSLFITAPFKITAQQTVVKKEKVVKKNKNTKSCCTAAIPNRFDVKTKSNFTGSKTVTNPNIKNPDGMVWIPGGTFDMGGDNDQARQDEFPKHAVKLNGFFMDVTEVTNAQFAKFVAATGYVTTAEKDINWEDLKKQLPSDTPKPEPETLKAASLVFVPTEGEVS